jgi:hypothetical protein
MSHQAVEGCAAVLDTAASGPPHTVNTQIDGAGAARGIIVAMALSAGLWAAAGLAYLLR